MFFIYFLIIVMIEIGVFILHQIRRKKIEKAGEYVDAIILSSKCIIGKPNRYRFELMLGDVYGCKSITVNGSVGKQYEAQGIVPIIYVNESKKVYLQKESFSEKILCIIIIIITFVFAFLCL